MKEGQWKLAARLTKGHTGSVYDLIVAYGYIWSEAADGSRILWKPFVSRPRSNLAHFPDLIYSIFL